MHCEDVCCRYHGRNEWPDFSPVPKVTNRIGTGIGAGIGITIGVHDG